MLLPLLFMPLLQVDLTTVAVFMQGGSRFWTGWCGWQRASLAALLSLAMYRLTTCGMSCIGFPFLHQSATGSLLWFGESCWAWCLFTCKNSAAPLWVFMAVALFTLRLMVSCWFLSHVPLSCSVAHSFVRPTVWNRLPLELRLLPRDLSDTFYETPFCQGLIVRSASAEILKGHGSNFLNEWTGDQCVF